LNNFKGFALLDEPFACPFGIIDSAEKGARRREKGRRECILVSLESFDLIPLVIIRIPV
jgi:hypothetical protein